MSTRKQRAAHRRDAQNSTAPRTTEGQAASSYNALKHGIFAVHQIMFDETAADLAELAAEYHEQYSPANPNQRFLVDTLIANEWRLRRMRRVEAVLWEHAADAYLTQHPESEACNSAHAFATNSGYFERLQRVVNACERNYHRALKELQLKVGQAPSHANVPANVPANPDAADPDPNPDAPPQSPQPQQSTPSSANLGSVRQNPKTPASTAPKPPHAPPLAGLAAPADPAESRPRPSDSFPDRMDAAFQAIFKQP